MKITLNFKNPLPKAPPKVRATAVVGMGILLIAFICTECAGFPFNGNPISWLSAKEKYLDGVEERRRYRLPLAVKKLEAACKIYPNDANFQYSYGEVLEQVRDLPDAEQHLQQAVRLNKSFTNAWLHLGATQFELGKAADAEASTREALKVDPQNAEAQCQLSTLLFAQKKNEEADKLYEQCKRDSKNATARYWFLRGQHELSTGKLDDALPAFKRAALKDRGAADYALTYGNLLFKSGRANESLYWLQNAAELNPDSVENWEALALAQHAAGNNEKAASDLSKAISLEPTNMKNQVRYAVLMHEMRRWKQAETAFRKLIDKGTTDIAIWNMYMDAVSQSSNFATARAIFTDIANKGNETTKSFALTYLGDVYRLQGSADASYQSYEQALALNPPDELKKYLDDRMKEKEKEDAHRKQMRLSPDVLRSLKNQLSPQAYQTLQKQLQLKP